ncbi:MAG TPA: BrnT family toxin [Thermoanaerobaculia bacterium]
MQSDRFEWDDDKAELNVIKHGVSFVKAADVFDDPFSITVSDLDHSYDEEREVTFGSTLFNEVLVVVSTTREDRTRIISARQATKAERRTYMNKKSDEIRDAMLPDYTHLDWSKGVRGKYYNPKNATTILMRVDGDVARHFATSQQLNDALRTLIAEGRAPEPRNE